MVAGVCIDLYSTLVHESPANPFYRRVAEELSLDFERWIPAYRARGKDSMAGRLAGMAERIQTSGTDCGLARPIGAVRAVVARCFPLFIESVTVDPGALPLLDHLRGRGLRLALVSNASSYTEQILEALGLDVRSLFDAVVLSYQLRILKPDPLIYRTALRLMGASAESCFFVGDGGDDELKGASRLGLSTVLVGRGLKHTAAARMDADVSVDSLYAVPGAISALQSRRRPEIRPRGSTRRSDAVR